MRLRALDIQQLPGTGAFRIEGLAPGTNLITGPNGVGKSSLTRALRYLIGGARPGDPPALALSAELEGADGPWRVRRTGSQVVWSRDGQAIDPPALPDADLLHCYWLRVEDLLSTDAGRDTALVERLRRELSGGFDLDAVRDAAPFDFGPRTGQKEGRELQDARARRQRVESGYQALHGEGNRLPELEAEAEAAKAAGRRAERLRQAVSLLAARRERLAAEERLTAFPAHMDRLHGNELERLAELEGERARCIEARDRQERERREAATRLAETGLAAERPAAADFQAQREHLAERTRLADRLDQEQNRLAESGAQEQQAAADLGGAEAPPSLDLESVRQAEAVAGRLHQARRARDAQQAKLDALDDEESDRPIDRAPTRRFWIAGLALAGGGAAVVATVLAAPWWGVLAAIVATGAGLWGLVDALGQGAGARADADGRARRQRELGGELRQAEAALDECERERRTFCAERGIDPALFDGASLDRFIRLAVELDRARARRREVEHTLAGIEAAIAAQDRFVRDFLGRWQTAPEAEDGASLRASLEAFEARCQAAGEADATRRQAEGEIERLKEELGRTEARIRQLYEDAGVEAGERGALEERCAAHEDWLRRQQETRDAISVEDERRRPLADQPELLARVETGDEDGLEADRETQERQAEGHDRLRDEITGIRTRLDQAGRDGALEKASTEEAQAREALADHFDHAMLAEAGRFLLDGVASEYQDEHEPAVLQDARERFARFTHHAWSLEMDPRQGFHAVETVSGEPRSLVELSSGTRMQLLLAVRMAWARQIEREKEPLPLFLDEALTTSDEGRFGEVAESLEQLVRDEGRQVFYLSARRQEIALWERATGRRPHTVDLAAVRFGRSGATADDYALPEADALPPPGDRAPEQYAAALGVPPVDPRQPAAGLHLFHLLRDDLALLHQLMDDWRITRLGQLEALLASEAAERAVPDGDLRATLAGRCRAAGHWTAIWRQGRGKPVDRGVLEAAGIVSSTFIGRVADLAEQLGGDGAALIEALRAGEVPRFRSTTTDELADWLRANGHIDPAEPPDADERERQTLQTAADDGHPREIRRLVQWLESAASGPATMTGKAGAAEIASA